MFKYSADHKLGFGMQPQDTLKKPSFKGGCSAANNRDIQTHYLFSICSYSVVCIKQHWWAESDFQGMDKLNENH